MRRARGWVVALLSAMASPAVAAPQHVVSTNLCTDEYVFRLLPRDRIAALSFLAADRHPVVSTIVDKVKGIALVHDSAEEVLSYRPDAVVMYAGTETRLHAQLREAGIPIIEVGWANSLADIRRETLALGHALGEDARAHGLLAQMDGVLAHAPSVHPPVPTLIYEPNGYASSDSVTDEIMTRAGLSNDARAIGLTRSDMVPMEDVVAHPPELLLIGASDARPSLSNLFLQHPALSSLAGKIAVGHLRLTALACPGPWSVGLVPELAALGAKARALAQRKSGH